MTGYETPDRAPGVSRHSPDGGQHGPFHGNSTNINVYFAGKLIWQESSNGAGAGPAVLDRLGSVVSNWKGQKYYPYGEEYTTTHQDRTKFATYYRDYTTALDYANQRYYGRTIGRFLTPDPYMASGGPADPQSWNRYSYVQGDPVNFNDPSGLFREKPESPPIDYCSFNPLDPFCRPGSMGVKGDPGIADTPDGVAVTFLKPEPDCTALREEVGMSGFTDGVAQVVSTLASRPEVQALIAFTWFVESGFSNHPKNNINYHRDGPEAAIARGDVDIGPMQLNYRTWRTSVTDPTAVFGTNLGTGAFNGDPLANLTFATGFLEKLYDRYGDRAAGYYRTGEGAFFRSPEGQKQYLIRQNRYAEYVTSLKRFFEQCY